MTWSRKRLLQELPERCHDPYPGSLAAHENICVVGIADEAQAPPRQFLVQLVEDDVRQHRRERTALRGSFLDGDPCAVRHHHGGFQHPAHEVEDTSVGDPLAHPIQQALMMDPVEKFRQVQIHHRPIARFQIPGRFGDRRVGTTVGAEPVTAGMESGFVDRLQNLKHGLLNHPSRHIRNAKPALPTAGLGYPNPPDVARSEAFRQQITAQRGERRGACASASSTVWPSTPGAPLLRITFSSARARFASDATSSSSRSGSAARAAGPAVVLRLAVCSSHGRCSDASDYLSVAAPLRAVGEHEAQLTVSRPSQPISPFAQPAFTGVIAPTKRSDFCMGIVPSSLPPSGLPLARTHADLPG